MKPGHIQVFDGLRITTEHMNHLQGSLHSALEDIRQIVGLSKVHAGFDIVKENDQTIVVQPGLAFDSHKNRITSDEPKHLAVAFATGEETKYVCIKYEQVEDGVVEGQPTLIWDSCSVLLLPAPPAPTENLVAIGALVWRTEANTFTVIGIPAANGATALPDTAATAAPAAGPAEQSSTAESATEAPGSIPSAPGTGTERAAEGDAPIADSVAPPASPAPAAETVATPHPWRLQVQQGVLHLNTGREDLFLNTMLAEPLRHKLSSNGDTGELHFGLAQEVVALDFPPASLTCHVQLLLTFGLERGPDAAEAPLAEEAIPPYQEVAFQATAHGEATLTGQPPAQFGLTTIQAYPGAQPGGKGVWTSELSEQGIAHLSLRALQPEPLAESAVPIWDILSSLQVLVHVNRGQSTGFQVASKLLWKGGIRADMVDVMEQQRLRLRWECHVAWKALGE